MRRDAQRAQLQLSAPAQLDDEDREWRAFKTLRARFYYDPGFALLEGEVQEHVADRVHRVNEALQTALHARLDVESVRALPATPPGQVDLDTILSRLSELDAGDDVEVIIALVGALPVATFSFHDLGRADVLGKHIAIRSMSNHEELRALDTFDALEPEERSRMYQQRKHHKEATVMLHEIGHALGAVHTTDANDIMHARYEHTMHMFSPHNVELMQLALDERLRPAEDQDLKVLATAMKNRLLAAPADLFPTRERSEHLARLEAVIAPAEALKTARTNSPGSAARDLSALSDEDKKRVTDAAAKQAGGDFHGAFNGLSELADKYPHTHFLQHEACDAGMKLRKSFKEIRAYCDRVAAAAVATPPAGR